jgi:hypothetical protein
VKFRLSTDEAEFLKGLQYHVGALHPDLERLLAITSRLIRLVALLEQRDPLLEPPMPNENLMKRAWEDRKSGRDRRNQPSRPAGWKPGSNS